MRGDELHLRGHAAIQIAAVSVLIALPREPRSPNKEGHRNGLLLPMVPLPQASAALPAHLFQHGEPFVLLLERHSVQGFHAGGGEELLWRVGLLDSSPLGLHHNGKAFLLVHHTLREHLLVDVPPLFVLDHDGEVLILVHHLIHWIHWA